MPSPVARFPPVNITRGRRFSLSQADCVYLPLTYFIINSSNWVVRDVFDKPIMSSRYLRLHALNRDQRGCIGDRATRAFAWRHHHVLYSVEKEKGAFAATRFFLCKNRLISVCGLFRYSEYRQIFVLPNNSIFFLLFLRLKYRVMRCNVENSLLSIFSFLFTQHNILIV